MTVQELYDWAKERDLLDKQVAKFYNFIIADIDSVYYMTREQIKKPDGRVILN